MTFIDFQGYFSLFDENKYSLLFRSLIKRSGDLTKDNIYGDFEWPLKSFQAL